ncbi:hypothetical protein J2755_000672 [Methanohalophilus levihalophilus]|uniref:hypothetical protein n=1 Tax=Methanohalophilus levihalophilus TaxID=1431282 RepID=UPI001AE38F35|nr:hypothetical protein [Methanohalophilus levihalophilus]MBP2029752.1 hypothetical protein [Methanohalophilus levihalophilus]
MGKKPIVWSRPDSSGKRTDITSERTNLSRKQKEALANGGSVKRKQKTEDTAPVTSGPASSSGSSGKEYVFEFSRPISSRAAKYAGKLAKLLGGKQAYIEDQTKLVVVM